MHSFNFIALSAFIKTHLSQREREKTKRRDKKVVSEGRHRWRVRERRKGRKERYKRKRFGDKEG